MIGESIRFNVAILDKGRKLINNWHTLKLKLASLCDRWPSMRQHPSGCRQSQFSLGYWDVARTKKSKHLKSTGKEAQNSAAHHNDLGRQTSGRPIVSNGTQQHCIWNQSASSGNQWAPRGDGRLLTCKTVYCIFLSTQLWRKLVLICQNHWGWKPNLDSLSNARKPTAKFQLLGHFLSVLKVVCRNTVHANHKCDKYVNEAEGLCFGHLQYFYS